MAETTILPEYVDRSFGFDVTLHNAPMRKVWGEWALDLNHNTYRDAVLSALVMKQGPLTGNQARFVRHVFQEPPSAFAVRCGVSEAAVVHWEARLDESAKIEPTAENRLRFLALDAVSPDARQRLIQRFMGEMSLSQVVVELGRTIWQALMYPKSHAHLSPIDALLVAP